MKPSRFKIIFIGLLLGTLVGGGGFNLVQAEEGTPAVTKNEKKRSKKTRKFSKKRIKTSKKQKKASSSKKKFSIRHQDKKRKQSHGV